MAVGAGDRRRAGRLHAQPQAAFGRHRLEHRCDRERGRAQVHRLHVERHLAGVQARQVEDVVDDQQQVARRLPDVREVALGALAQPRRLLALDHLGKSEHRVQRRAQLVADTREHVHLRLRPDLEQGVLAREFFGGLALRDVLHRDSAHGGRAVVPAGQDAARMHPLDLADAREHAVFEVEAGAFVDGLLVGLHDPGLVFGWM